jgi:hypothetical protein
MGGADGLSKLNTTADGLLTTSAEPFFTIAIFEPPYLEGAQAIVVHGIKNNPNHLHTEVPIVYGQMDVLLDALNNPSKLADQSSLFAILIQHTRRGQRGPFSAGAVTAPTIAPMAPSRPAGPIGGPVGPGDRPDVTTLDLSAAGIGVGPHMAMNHAVVMVSQAMIGGMLGDAIDILKRPDKLWESGFTALLKFVVSGVGMLVGMALFLLKIVQCVLVSILIPMTFFGALYGILPQKRDTLAKMLSAYVRFAMWDPMWALILKLSDLVLVALAPMGMAMSAEGGVIVGGASGVVAIVLGLMISILFLLAAILGPIFVNKMLEGNVTSAFSTALMGAAALAGGGVLMAKGALAAGSAAKTMGNLAADGLQKAGMDGAANAVSNFTSGPGILGDLGSKASSALGNAKSFLTSTNERAAERVRNKGVEDLDPEGDAPEKGKATPPGRGGPQPPDDSTAPAAEKTTAAKTGDQKLQSDADTTPGRDTTQTPPEQTPARDEKAAQERGVQAATKEQARDNDTQRRGEQAATKIATIAGAIVGTSTSKAASAVTEAIETAASAEDATSVDQTTGQLTADRVPSTSGTGLAKVYSPQELRSDPGIFKQVADSGQKQIVVDDSFATLAASTQKSMRDAAAGAGVSILTASQASGTSGTGGIAGADDPAAALRAPRAELPEGGFSGSSLIGANGNVDDRAIARAVQATTEAGRNAVPVNFANVSDANALKITQAIQGAGMGVTAAALTKAVTGGIKQADRDKADGGIQAGGSELSAKGKEDLEKALEAEQKSGPGVEGATSVGEQGLKEIGDKQPPPVMDAGAIGMPATAGAIDGGTQKVRSDAQKGKTVVDRDIDVEKEAGASILDVEYQDRIRELRGVNEDRPIGVGKVAELDKQAQIASALAKTSGIKDPRIAADAALKGVSATAAAVLTFKEAGVTLTHDAGSIGTDTVKGYMEAGVNTIHLTQTKEQILEMAPAARQQLNVVLHDAKAAGIQVKTAPTTPVQQTVIIPGRATEGAVRIAKAMTTGQIATTQWTDAGRAAAGARAVAKTLSEDEAKSVGMKHRGGQSLQQSVQSFYYAKGLVTGAVETMDSSIF